MTDRETRAREYAASMQDYHDSDLVDVEAVWLAGRADADAEIEKLTRERDEARKQLGDLHFDEISKLRSQLQASEARAAGLSKALGNLIDLAKRVLQAESDQNEYENRLAGCGPGEQLIRGRWNINSAMHHLCDGAAESEKILADSHAPLAQAIERVIDTAGVVSEECATVNWQFGEQFLKDFDAALAELETVWSGKGGA